MIDIARSLLKEGYKALFLSRVLGINRSTLYLKQREEPIRDLEIKAKLLDIKIANPCYGYRRLTLALREEGEAVNHKKVLRLLSEMGELHPGNVQPRQQNIIKAVYLTPKLGINLIRDFVTKKPFQVVHTDFTVIDNKSGRYYLIVYLCGFSKYVLSWRLSTGPDKETALGCFNSVKHLLTSNSYIHQDQGSAFTSDEYIDTLIRSNVFISFSRKGKPSDNGEIESFFGRFKKEWKTTYSNTCNYKDLNNCVSKAIVYYNSRRIHSTLKMSPASFLKRRTNSINSVHS